MKIGVLVNEGPYQHQAADTAVQFAKALDKRHEVFRVSPTRIQTKHSRQRRHVTPWAADVQEPR